MVQYRLSCVPQEKPWPSRKFVAPHWTEPPFVPDLLSGSLSSWIRGNTDIAKQRSRYTGTDQDVRLAAAAPGVQVEMGEEIVACQLV